MSKTSKPRILILTQSVEPDCQDSEVVAVLELGGKMFTGEVYGRTDEGYTSIADIVKDDDAYKGFFEFLAEWRKFATDNGLEFANKIGDIGGE